MNSPPMLLPDASRSFFYIPGEDNIDTIQNTLEVMQPVFKHLGFGDLRQARLVCRSWNDVVCTGARFWDLSVMTIRGDPDLALTFLRTREFQNWKHFKFVAPLLDSSSQIQTSFWTVLGRNIASLTLLSHSLSPVEFLQVLSACSNLKSLTFSCRNIYRGHGQPETVKQLTSVMRLVDNVQCYRSDNLLGQLTYLKILDSNLVPPGVLRDLLQLTYKVTHLCLHDTNMATVPLWQVGDIVRYVADRRSVVKKLELTGSHIFPEYVEALSKIADLRLTSLHLRFAKVTDFVLLTLFKQQKNLVELDLSFTQCSQRCFLHLQCSFAKLKRLILRGFSSNITSFAFLARMPNLEDLDLSGTFSTSMSWEHLIDSLLPLRFKKLKSLNFSFNLGLGVFPRAKLFTSLVSSVNHITCLNLSQNTFVKDSIVHNIWRHLTHLKVVFLEYLSGMSTEGISGIRHSQMQTFLANGTLDKINPALLRIQNSGGSYIGLCPDIETLSLAYNSRLNDFIIPFGITDLENLKKLKLTCCSQISAKYLLDLITYCGKLEYLDVSGTQISGEWAEWAKKANPKIRRIVFSDYLNLTISQAAIVAAQQEILDMPSTPAEQEDETAHVQNGMAEKDAEELALDILSKRFDSDTEGQGLSENMARGDRARKQSLSKKPVSKKVK